MKSLLFSRYLKFILFLLLAFGLSSCYKDRFDINKLEKGGVWSPDVAAPVVNTTLTLNDILNRFDSNGVIQQEPNGFLYLLYTNNIFSQKAEDLIVIPYQNINTSFSFSVVGALPFGVDLTAAPNTINYSCAMPYNAVIDEFDAKAGMFEFAISSPDLNHNATVNVSIPSATLGGIPFNQDLNFTAGSTLSQQLSLAGYKILFDNTGANPNNLAITYTVTLHGSGGPNNSPYNINMGEDVNGLKFSKILGDLKQIPYDLPNDTVRIQFFNNNITGMIDFADPKVHLFAYNSFGLPIRVTFNSFVATDGRAGTSPVTLTGLTAPWDIIAPTNIGQIAFSQLNLDKNNSNIWDAVFISPKKFIANISGISNPAGGISNNFALDTSRLKIDAQIEMPFFGRAWDFVLQDTNTLEFGQDLDKVEFIDFRLNTANGFPVEAVEQLFFLDANDHVIDSLLSPEQQILAPAPCGGAPDYRVTSTSSKMTDIIFYKSRLLPLKNCKKIITRDKLQTTNSATEYVKFYSDYSIKVRVGLRVKFDVNY